VKVGPLISADRSRGTRPTATRRAIPSRPRTAQATPATCAMRTATGPRGTEIPRGPLGRLRPRPHQRTEPRGV